MLPLLEIKDLTIEFESEGNTTPALHGISLRVDRGEILAIVGESGSGKSITSLSILQLLPSPPAKFTRGEILFSRDGIRATDLLRASGKELKSVRGNAIAMIFQEPMSSLNPVFSCGSQVQEAILEHKKISRAEARKATIRLFEKVKLPDPERIYKSFPHQLSGGQKQRVMIAMAMSCEPELLIADEPTTALDVTVQRTILDLIRELQLQENMGVIFISHDLGVVSEIADRIAVMYRGTIVEEGPTARIIQNPQQPYTKALLACRPILHTKGERLPVVDDFLGTPQEKQPAVRKELLQNDNKQEPSKAMLVVKELSVYFPNQKSWTGKILSETRAVDGVSFEVAKGETLGLVGESGCGKSTLGRAVLRLIEPSAGDVWLNGVHINRLPKENLRTSRRDIQIIFQDPYSSLNPRIRIGDAILEPMEVHGLEGNQAKRKQKVIHLLEKVNLQPDHFNRYPHEFSGGQRQRIGIARALALDPSFIICDESVSALDVSVQAQVLNLLNDLKKEFGFTSIFISHDLGVVHYISDRIMVMNKGKIVELGTADEVFHRPKEAYTKRLIASIPKV
jgi:peptide/nickel transport system ATP-binding protein